MKKFIYSFVSLLAIATVSFSSVSCESEKLQVDDSPKFPDLITENDIEPGTELELTFTPNQSWSVSIPADNYKWFKIKDGKFEVQTLSGVSSSEPVTITIVTSSEESFSVRSTDVLMKMGGQEQVIAKYSLKVLGRSIQVYPASVNENGSYVFGDDHQHVYETEEMARLELKWDDNDEMFYFPIKVVANFEWTIQWPSWARADIKGDTRIGEICFDVYGVSSALPYDGAEGEIKLLSGDEVIKTYPIAIPACKDKFKFSLSGNTSLTYDHAGYMHTETGDYTKEPIPGIIFGPKESRIVILEKNASGNYVEAESPWLNLSVDNWDSVEGADVLQTRNMTVSAPKYLEGTDREAILLFLPATAPEDLSGIVTSSGVVETYQQYAVMVYQTGRPDKYLTFEATAGEMETVGVAFAEAEADLLPEKNFDFAEGFEEYQYNLSFVKEMASSKSTLFILEPFEEIIVYDAEGNEIEGDISNHWLNFRLLGEGLKGQVVMDVSKFTTGAPSKVDGYIAFVNDEGKVLCVVHCFYEKEEEFADDQLVDVSDEFFVDPDAAKLAGAVMYEVKGGPTYENHEESLAPIYILTYTEDNTELEIKTSTELFLYMCQGKYAGPEMVTIDDEDFDQNSGFLLDYDEETEAYVGTYSGITSVRMKMPEEYVTADTMVEVIQFMKSQDADGFVMTVICMLDLRSENE